jgi:protein-S-isoprenylcysteine O-methyltransferase Ste14
LNSEGVIASASGERAPWVVRHRIALSWGPALLYFVAIIISRGQLRDDAVGEATKDLGYLLIIAGSMGRIWCAIYIAGRKNKELCTDGPYSICRNPLYVFSYFGMMGLAIGANNVVLAAIATPIFWIYYAVVIRSEESVLSGLFGESFEEYKRKVPAVLPKFSGYWTRPEFSIQPKKVLAGMVDAMWFLWAVMLLEVLEHAKGVYFGR